MKLRKQRCLGVVLVVVSVALMLLVSTGSTPQDRDATAILVTLPLGIYMIFAPHYILYDGKSAAARHERSLTTWQEKE